MDRHWLTSSLTACFADWLVNRVQDDACATWMPRRRAAESPSGVSRLKSNGYEDWTVSACLAMA